MSFVVDASVTLSWILKDEASARTDPLLVQVKDAGAEVPALWPLEIASGLWSAERRRRVAAADVPVVVKMLLSLPIAVHELPQRLAFGSVLQLAREQQLTVYDAAYLDLARRLRIPLATLDTDLAAAARRIGVDLML